MYFTDLNICGSECESCKLENEKVGRFHFMNLGFFMSFSFIFKMHEKNIINTGHISLESTNKNCVLS